MSYQTKAKKRESKATKFEARMSPANGPTVQVPKDEVIDDENLSRIGSTLDSVMSYSSLGCNYVNGRR